MKKAISVLFLLILNSPSLADEAISIEYRNPEESREAHRVIRCSCVTKNSYLCAVPVTKELCEEYNYDLEGSTGKIYEIKGTACLGYEKDVPFALKGVLTDCRRITVPK